MKIALIGYGNIANALINGMISSGKILLTDDLYIFHNNKKKIHQHDKCTFMYSGEKCNHLFDIIFLCVKPNDIEAAINENIDLFNDNQAIVSVAAGVKIKTIKSLIKRDSGIIRAMPNLCAVLNESITGFCSDKGIQDDKKDHIEKIFRSIGYVREIKEEEMDSFTALFGSGPAYIMYFIESLMKCEKFDSISEEDKSLLILNLLSSTSKMLLVTENISDLRKKVTSEGGTTEAAIKLFENRDFMEIMKDAIQEATKKSIDMSK